MKKIVILLAVAALSASCAMGDKETDSRTAYELFNFTSSLVTKSINGPADIICKNLEDRMFEEGYIDTLWARNAGLDYVIKRTPDDSLWMIYPCDGKDEGYNFYTFVRMLPEGVEGHNHFLVQTSGTYTEGEYHSDFRTNGDFFLRWEEEADTYSGLYFSICARPYGEFNAENYLDTRELDFCKLQYSGQDVTYDTSRGAGSISRYYYF